MDFLVQIRCAHHLVQLGLSLLLTLGIAIVQEKQELHPGAFQHCSPFLCPQALNGTDENGGSLQVANSYLPHFFSP